MKTREKVIAITVIFGIVITAIDALLDYFIFYEGELWGLLLTNIPIREIFTRSLLLACFIVFGIVLSRVITKRQQAIEQFQRSETRYRYLFENMLEGFAFHKIIVNNYNKPVDYLFLELNNTFETFTGLSRDIIGKQVTSVLPDIFDTNPNLIEIYGKVALNGEPTKFDYYFSPLGKWFSVSAFCPQIGYFVTVFDDITQKKQAESALKEAKRSIQQQNAELKKLDKIKDGLIRDVSHELKTPVAKYKMQLDLLKQILAKHRLTKECSKVIQTMESTIKRQESMVYNILDLSRLEAGGRKYHIEPIRLDKVIEDVCEDYKPAIDAYDIKVEKELEDVTIESDKEMLFHVFSNLINNALKYRNGSDSPRLRVSAARVNGNVVTKIADNGIGFSNHEADQMFERFYQASPSAEGCGVGLTITKMIVEDLGGTISLQSEGKHKGATAIVELPALKK